MSEKNQQPMGGTEALYEPMEMPVFIERWHHFATPTVPESPDRQDAFALWEGKQALADLERAGIRDGLFLHGGVRQLPELPKWKLTLFAELNEFSNFYREVAWDAARLRSRYLDIRDALAVAQTKIRKGNASVKDGRFRPFADGIETALERLKNRAEAAPGRFWHVGSWGNVFNRSEPDAIPARSRDLDGEYQRRVFRVLCAHLQPPVLSAPDPPKLTLCRLVLLTYLAAGLARVKDNQLLLTFSGPRRSGRTAPELTAQRIARNTRHIVISECEGEPNLIPGRSIPEPISVPFRPPTSSR